MIRTRPLVRLCEITDETRAAVEGLAVAPDQVDLVDGVAPSLAEAAAKPDAHPWCRAIYAGSDPVGFLMLADGVPAGHPEIPAPYYLWRLLIDADQQKRGYGTAALRLLVKHLEANRPDASELVTSAVPGPGSPIPFYEAFGFVATGAMLDREVVYALPLRKPAH